MLRAVHGGSIRLRRCNRSDDTIDLGGHAGDPRTRPTMTTDTVDRLRGAATVRAGPRAIGVMGGPPRCRAHAVHSTTLDTWINAFSAGVVVSGATRTSAA